MAVLVMSVSAILFRCGISNPLWTTSRIAALSDQALAGTSNNIWVTTFLRSRWM
ncbi:hypothetical protein BIWAKO_06112 [Bosea sp. BIWAKO-01]|nr:hypothetical protein BIWAKO_06112 [Bosea sp. BIWAKO-01]